MPDDSSSTDLIPYQPTKPPAPKRPYVRRNPGGPRVPPADGGIQSNFCRNINCDNFGVEPLQNVPRGTSRPGGDGYRLNAGGRQNKTKLHCTKCGQSSSIKSNAGIREELKRISAYLEPTPMPSCPNVDCASHGISVLDDPARNHSHGYTSAGSPRWRCKACRKVFSARKANRDQLMSHKNAIIFRMLVNKGALKGMARVADVSPQTVYDKIDFIHRQCLAFLAGRERQIATLGLRRLYISSDRQDYVLNWSSRKDRKNTAITAVASADNRSGYVFGMQTNIDPSVDTERMEAEAIVAGDFAILEPSFRRFARFWTTPDYETAKIDDPAGVPSRLSDTGDVRADVVAGYDEMAAIADPEAKERAPTTTALPTSCAQVHFEYTVHAHFRLLRRMLGDVGKIRFFMDQDDTLRAGCISTYVEEMRAGRADAFYVKIDKGLNVDQRNRLASQSTARFKKFKDSIGRPGMSDWWVRVLLLEVEIQSAMEQLSPRDRWVVYPESTQAEPLKAVCWLTDRDGVAVPLRQMAIVFARASMHAIDRYFMQVRRLLMALERPIHTPSNDGRVWRGYSPYDPARVQKLLDIYRCYYNFVKKGRDRKTPAMRLGLAKGPIRIEDILYFDPTCRAEVAARRRA